MEISSLSALTAEVRKLKDTHHVLWYRGQNNADYKLIPSLLRSRNKGLQNEKAIYETYRRFAQRLNPKHDNEWELLIDMQHYFVPTRLLDWTESLGIALFFATSNNAKGNNAGFFVLDPVVLNSKSNKNDIPTMPFNTMGLSYVESYIKKIPYPAPHPIAFQTSFSNERVMAQRGMFTIHTDSSRGLEEDYSDAIWKFTLTESAIDDIRDFLEIANINVYSVFPDFYGLADYIKYTYLT